VAEYADPQTLERLVRIETKLDYMTDTFRSLEKRLDSQDVKIETVEKSIPDQDHETRIRKIERAMWIVAGLAAAGGGTAGGLVSQIFGA